MRWENLTIENEDSAALPGFRDPAVIRTFDAPEVARPIGRFPTASFASSVPWP